MPMGNYVPSTGSSFSGASVPGSVDRPIWLTLTQGGTASAMVRLHPAPASGATTAIIALISPSLGTVGPVGPFILHAGAYIEGPSGTGASAFVALQPGG